MIEKIEGWADSASGINPFGSFRIKLPYAGEIHNIVKAVHISGDYFICAHIGEYGITLKHVNHKGYLYNQAVINKIPNNHNKPIPEMLSDTRLFKFVNQ